jgi:hypothetical protein
VRDDKHARGGRRSARIPTRGRKCVGLVTLRQTFVRRCQNCVA